MARSPRASASASQSAVHAPGPLFEVEVNPAPVSPVRSRLGLVPVALVGSIVAAGLWGAWVTKSLLVQPARPAIARIQLSGIVSEYVQAQARSATPPDQVTAETRAFMTEIQHNLERRGAKGQLVLVGEAVLAGNVPDITADVRREVYTRVRMPQPAPSASSDVMGAMRAAMAGSNAGPQATSAEGQGHDLGH